MEKINKRWLTPDEVEKEFNISKSTQAKWRMQKKIPFSKVGKFVLYDLHEINNWLEMSKA